MKNYLKHFRFLFIGTGVLLVIFIVLFLVKRPLSVYVRTNSQEEERVFDYADKLTDEEEEALRELIAEKEGLIGCDIVLVTIDDSSIDSDYAMMNYGDDFFDERRYGYNMPWGDGALYLDNWGSGYCWLSTSGRVEDSYSTEDIDNLINEVCATVNDDPYGAYKTYVESLSSKMLKQETAETIPMTYILGAAFIITFAYVLMGLVHNKGKKTTTASTYVAGGQPLFRDRRDIFVTKHTTSRHIERSSGGSGGAGGGGGHHISSGGHSHGGGGGRH